MQYGTGSVPVADGLMAARIASSADVDVALDVIRRVAA
jgi:hypothetical protein